MFDLAALESAGDDGLGGTIFAGHLHFSPVTDSTNDDALAAARKGAPHGSVFFADEQLAGRGRGIMAGTLPPVKASTSQSCCARNFQLRDCPCSRSRRVSLQRMPYMPPRD